VSAQTKPPAPDDPSYLFETLICTRCGAEHEPTELQTTCARGGCGRPLAARYAVEPVPRPASGEREGAAGPLWRLPELMPIGPETDIVTLGEGGTPLLRATRLGQRSGLPDLWIKDESGNPTGSFKARGMAVAVTKAVELGAQAIAVPTAGNAGSAAAAYAARAGIDCVVVMPADTPPVFRREIADLGATLIEHDGLIDECGKIVAERAAAEGWFDVSTLKEPYRVEGKKTLGTEIAEQLGWELPDAIVYPTGGGTGLVGMWKAFNELGGIGWVHQQRPRMYAVQAAGCAPVVRAFDAGAKACARFENATTHAAGLRVPRPFADEWILAVLGRSNGGAIAVAEDEIREGVDELARVEGIYACPEGGAAWAGARKLRARGDIAAGERVVVVNTGSAYKYM
jgi:threonine synthase